MFINGFNIINSLLLNGLMMAVMVETSSHDYIKYIVRLSTYIILFYRGTSMLKIFT